jgi:cytochrome c-type protein NapB
MFRRILPVLLLAAVIAMAARIVIQNRAADEPAISDRDLGLRKTALTDDRVPSRFVFTDATPGGNERVARAYDGAPPVIPHSLDGFVPITSSENSCLLCHQNGSTDAADPPQVPRSHLTDFRRVPNVVRDTVAGARWNCTACHVMQSDAPLLVENHFKSGGR